MGLQTSLDIENGGEIAKNLNELYTYISEEFLKSTFKMMSKLLLKLEI